MLTVLAEDVSGMRINASSVILTTLSASAIPHLLSKIFMFAISSLEDLCVRWRQMDICSEHRARLIPVKGVWCIMMGRSSHVSLARNDACPCKYSSIAMSWLSIIPRASRQ